MKQIELGTILHMEKGKKPKLQSKDAIKGYLPYVDIKAFEQGIIDNYASTEKVLLCEDGDLLIVGDGSRSGLTGRAIKGIVGSTLYKIYADGMTTDYLRYFIESKYLLLNTQKKGTGTPHLNANILKKSKLIVPSIEEQERIVEKIEELFSELDNAVETLNITEKKLHLYRQSVIKEAFTGSFTESYRKSNDTALDMELPWLSEEQTMGLPKIPESWKYILLSNLGDLGRGKSKHRPRNDARLFVDGKYPFIQTSEVKSADKYITEYSKMYNDFGLSQSKLWPSGTLCITIAANIAETAFLGLNACFPDSVVGFTPSDNILSEYIRYFIESQKAELSAFAPATAQKNINLTTLENLVIPYCSLKEQKRIVDEIESRLTAYLNIEKTVNDALQQAFAMRQSILQQAFEGRLL